MGTTASAVCPLTTRTSVPYASPAPHQDQEATPNRVHPSPALAAEGTGEEVTPMDRPADFIPPRPARGAPPGNLNALTHGRAARPLLAPDALAALLQNKNENESPLLPSAES